MKQKVNRIEIVFPMVVELPPGFTQLLSGVVDLVCKKYEEENPDRVMWPAGHGSKPIWKEPEEPEFDDNIFQISVAERENYKFKKATRKEEEKDVIR